MGLFSKKRAVADKTTVQADNTAIPAEVVAAIAGAIAVICGENASITGISRVSTVRETGRSAWSMAGLLANTRPFHA